MTTRRINLDVIPNMIWTYNWFGPAVSYDAVRQRITLCGVSSTGVAKIAQADLRYGNGPDSPLMLTNVREAVLKQSVRDDHDAGAVFVSDDKPILILSTSHGRQDYVSLWQSAAPHDLASLSTESQLAWTDGTSYGHIIRKPGTDTVMVLVRGGFGASGWFSRVSENPWAASPVWAAEQRTWGGGKYGCFKLSADGTIAWFAVTLHPSDDVSYVRVFKVVLATGVVSRPNDTNPSLENWWELTNLIPSTSMFEAVGVSSTSRLRLFDVSPNGDILFARWSDGDATVSYRMMRRNGNVFTEETLCDGGTPFGHSISYYVGGAGFDVGRNNIVLVREATADGNPGVWTLERWTRADSSEAWTKTILLSRSGGRKLARPIIPRGAEGKSVVAVCDLWSYDLGGYVNYYSDARIVIG